MTALVIGNADYPDGQNLANPVNDAEDFAAKLKGYGFNVLLATDCSVAKMEKKLKKFREALDEHDIGLFFFAGHGMQIEGNNYLLALDTDMGSEIDAKHSALSLDKVLEKMAASTAATKIVILDACRNNPWKRKWERDVAARGLASVYAPKGTIIGFATSPGETASDGEGRNGSYTAALLEHIDTPDCSIETMFKRVRNTVAASTTGRQTSWEHTSLAGEFFFNMSIGKLIDEYDGTALADRLFVLDEARASHQVIAGLKSHNWYRQNAAMKELVPSAVAKMSKNNLFVVGRNIYQAACGDAVDAKNFLNNFVTRTNSFPVEKRKALLDGVLFEIFFDQEGKLRPRIKSGFFSKVFELENVPALEESFAFIANALVAANANFYMLPGKKHQISATVKTKKRKKGYTVEGIYVDGIDVMRNDKEDWLDDDGIPMHIRISSEDLNEQLVEELVVPAHNLKISFSVVEAAGEELRIPIGWTVTKV